MPQALPCAFRCGTDVPVRCPQVVFAVFRWSAAGGKFRTFHMYKPGKGLEMPLSTRALDSRSALERPLRILKNDNTTSDSQLPTDLRGSQALYSWHQNPNSLDKNKIAPSP